jgi:(E)-4-hydroxy-3-methylbut-2-enyl-diphosphate synthase
MTLERRNTRTVKIGNVRIGAHSPVAIQSMAKAKTADVESVVRQIRELEAAGCEIIRVAVKDVADARAISSIKRNIKIPLVADIHFSWQLAMEAIEAGADKIRLNPGNIFRKAEIREVVAAAKLSRIPIRVGVNSGSLRSGAGLTQAQKMVRSALDYLKVIEGFGFRDIVVSLKASNILDTVEAYRLMAKKCDYPLHLGVTATGLPYAGAIKSSIAIGALLLEGIGDTIRISLTDKPAQEVVAAKVILEALGLRSFGPEIISCPTCGRCEVDLVKIVTQLEQKLSASAGKKVIRGAGKPMRIAIMGCVVNGPGEAKEADIGVAFGAKDGLLFKKGKPVRKIPFNKCVDVLLKEIR